MKSKYLLLVFAFTATTFFCQSELKKDTITKKAIIKYQINGNQLELIPETPALIQISGAPKAYYSYFWEFGDGKYSTQKKPKHIYKNKGNYEVKLWVTNHYDAGKPPATRPEKVSVKTIIEKPKDVSTMTDDFMLQKNREPVPNEELVLVLRYKNDKEYVTGGKLFLFYNEQKFGIDNFQLIDVRKHYNEKQVSEIDQIVYANDVFEDDKLYASISDDIEAVRLQVQDTSKVDLEKTIQNSKLEYKNWSIFNFEEMNPKEERNMFFTLKTTPEMLKDTSAIISIRGVYVPDDNYKNHKVKELEMEIVTSHDPNNMSSNGTFLNYRLVRFKKLKYKIRFQNNGEGPATTIRLETDIPKMLDKSSIEVLDMYPKTKICPKNEVSYSCLDTTFTKDKAIFTFKNIYLPGSNQKGVQEKDSTKGFVKYGIKFNDDFHKKKTRSRTAIFFDKNEPIITNTSTTRFLPGISVGIKTGYNYFSNLKNSKSYFLGATISPYKSYRWYWQAELASSLHSYNKIGVFNKESGENIQGSQKTSTITTTNNYNNIDVTIPLLVRYNINNYIGLGAGFQGVISVNEKNEENILTENFVKSREGIQLVDSNNEKNNSTNSFKNFRKGLLFEITGGFARIGPSVGARYVLNTKNDYNYWQFYAVWKF